MFHPEMQTKIINIYIKIQTKVKEWFFLINTMELRSGKIRFLMINPITMNLKIIYFLTFLIFSFGCQSQEKNNENKNTDMSYKVNKSEEEWKKELSPEEFHVLREKGTERAFTGDLNEVKKEGTFICAACKNELFSTGAKYESGSGWPSFYKPISEENVAIVKDYNHGMVRDEVVCATCGGHLGHVFPDGPKPTGLRYCVNSIAMDFKVEKR